jgi:uncharacterized protein DUF3617
MFCSRMLIAAVACSAAGTAFCAAPGVKPGLWERTVTRQMDGAPVSPVADLTKLPPEQRARIEQMMASRGSTTPSTSVVRYCVTPETVQSWETFAREGREDANCQRTVLDESSRGVKMSIVCAGGKQTGTVEFSAVSPDRVTGTVTTVQKDAGGERKVFVQVDSRWVASECGDVKPGQPSPVKG